jgi:Glycosyltransferase
MVIPSFVPDTIREELRLTARPPSLPDDDGYILFVGGLSSHKGLGTLLDAYSLMGTKVPLVLIGKRSADSPVQLPPGVNFVGEFAHADVMASYRHAGVVAMPSEWPEPFGLVAVEAMLAGAPLVASRVGGLADQVVDGVNGILVPPRSSHALAKALLAVLEDQRLRERLSVAARASAGQYTVSAICGQVEAVYERAIQIRRSRADVS